MFPVEQDREIMNQGRIHPVKLTVLQRNCIKIPGKFWPSSGRRSKSARVNI